MSVLQRLLRRWTRRPTDPGASAPSDEARRLLAIVGRNAQGDFSQRPDDSPATWLGQLARHYNRLLDAHAKAINQLESHAAEVYDWQLRIEDQAAELTFQSEELKEACAEAERANRIKDEFLANVSHEIRTPMTAILGYADLLLSEHDSSNEVSQRRDALETIKRNGEHLLDVINDILDISKIEAGRLDLECMPCRPASIIADVVKLLAPRAQEKGLSVKVSYHGLIPETILSDPTRLRQIVLNLLGNAIKFTEKGSVRVDVRLLHHGLPQSMLQMVVSDTGIGMTAEQLATLFEPFTQASTSITRNFGGTGLGLAISKRLAELLGGKITVQSASGHGSSFCLTIPTGSLARVNLERIFDGNSPATAISTKSADERKLALNCRILLAEDGFDNQRLISLVLKKAGAEVTAVENGLLAVEQVLAARDEGTPYDVVLMDMQMPVLDGYAATEKLRSAGYTGSIVALTAHAMAHDRNKCLEAGCDEYATKPIRTAGLIETIHRQLQTPRQPRQDGARHTPAPAPAP